MAQHFAHTTLHQLLDPRFLTKKTNGRQASWLSKNRGAGVHDSIFKGQGVDFFESRIYELGDDVRRIDWGVTARTGKLHTKIFTEDHEVPFLLIVDQSLSMYFGSRFDFKSVHAARLAAFLGWQAFVNGSRVGGVIFGEADYAFFKATSRKARMLNFLGTLNDFNRTLCVDHLATSNSSNFACVNRALSHAQVMLKAGSYNVVFISDGLSFNDESFYLMGMLAKSHYFSFYHVYDVFESGNFPHSGGHLRVCDGRSSQLMRLNGSSQKRLKARFEQRQEDLKSFFHKTGARYQPVDTSMKVEEV